MPALLALGITLARSDPNLHRDEIYWIGGTYYYQLLVHGDVWHPDWQLLPARENPPAGRYVLGAWLDGFGVRVATPDVLGAFYLLLSPERGGWGSGEAYAKRKAVADRMSADGVRLFRQGRFPLSTAALRTARVLMLVLGMTCAVLVTLIGWRCGTLLGGLVAGSAFALHPAVVQASSHALIDMVALTWCCLAVHVYLQLGSALAADRVLRGRAALAAATALGVTLAFACGTKMNSLIVVALGGMLWAWAMTVWLRRRRPAARQMALTLAAGVLLAFALFVALDPTLYPDPIGGLRALLFQQARTQRVQAALGFVPLATLAAKAAAVGRLVTGLPVLLGGLGLLALFYGWRAAGPAASVGERRFGVIVLWWGLAFLMVTAWIPFEWKRYALPLVVPTLLVVARAGEDLVRAQRRRAAQAVTQTSKQQT